MNYLTTDLNWEILLNEFIDSNINNKLVEEFENLFTSTKKRMIFGTHILEICKEESKKNIILKTEAFRIVEIQLQDYIKSTNKLKAYFDK